MEHSIPVVVPNPRAEQRFQYEAVAQAARYASDTVRELGKGLTDTQKMRLFLEAAGTFAGGVGETTSTTAAGNLKDIFAKLTDVRPMHAVLQESEEFESQDALGGTYKFPALLSFAGGSIPSAFGVIPSAAVINEGPVPPEVQFGTAQGYNITTPIAFPFDMMAASGNGPKSSYMTVANLIAFAAKMEAEREAELSHLLGQNGLGVVSAIGAETPFTDARLGAGFYRDITFTKASTADGIWAGADRHRFDFFNPAGTTQRNVTGALTYCSVINVQNSTSTVGPIVRFFFTTTANLNTLAANDIVWRRNFKQAGATAFSEALGLLNAFSVVGAPGTAIWGLDSGYTQWHATQYPVGGALTFGKIAKGLQVGVSRANLKKPMKVLVGNGGWADLLRDLADLTRNQQPPPTTLKNGAASIEYTIQCGPVKIVNHGFMPDGFAVAYPEDSCRRIGAMGEATDNLAGVKLQVMSGVTVQYNLFQNQAIVNAMLGACTLFNGIVNDA